MANKFIKIRGAKEHNLKDVSLDIPRDELVVLTGFRDLENLLLPLTQFMLRDREDIWSRYLPMQECFWDKWKSQM